MADEEAGIELAAGDCCCQPLSCSSLNLRCSLSNLLARFSFLSSSSPLNAMPWYDDEGEDRAEEEEEDGGAAPDINLFLPFFNDAPPPALAPPPGPRIGNVILDQSVELIVPD